MPARRVILQNTVLGAILQETYRIERELGKGGMGTVYEASHLRVPRRFAIKMLRAEAAEHPEALARFQREAEITSSLGHPHIVEVIDFNYTDTGEPYLIMELLKGQTLADRCRRRQGLPIADVGAIFRQAAGALHVAHVHGVVHRDLKPHNVFLCRRGSYKNYVKIVDFGVSKILGSQSLITGTTAMMGTPAYMAPEQAKGHADSVDRRADIYAMGVLLFEMLTGRLPFVGENVTAMVTQILFSDPPPPSSIKGDLPDGIDSIVLRALHKDREQRYPSMQEFWHALSAFFDEQQVEFPLPTEDRGTEWALTPQPTDTLMPDSLIADTPTSPATTAANTPRALSSTPTDVVGSGAGETTAVGGNPNVLSTVERSPTWYVDQTVKHPSLSGQHTTFRIRYQRPLWLFVALAAIATCVLLVVLLVWPRFSGNGDTVDRGAAPAPVAADAATTPRKQATTSVVESTAACSADGGICRPDDGGARDSGAKDAGAVPPDSAANAPDVKPDRKTIAPSRRREKPRSDRPTSPTPTEPKATPAAEQPKEPATQVTEPTKTTPPHKKTPTEGTMELDF